MKIKLDEPIGNFPYVVLGKRKDYEVTVTYTAFGDMSEGEVISYSVKSL